MAMPEIAAERSFARSDEKWSHAEGGVARGLERETAKLPSDTWLWAAVGSMAVSLGLQMYGRRSESLFVGQWAAPFLVLGVYNKLVKQLGSDRAHAPVS